jgi:hypothetical protein
MREGDLKIFFCFLLLFFILNYFTFAPKLKMQDLKNDINVIKTEEIVAEVSRIIILLILFLYLFLI